MNIIIRDNLVNIIIGGETIGNQETSGDEKTSEQHLAKQPSLDNLEQHLAAIEGNVLLRELHCFSSCNVLGVEADEDAARIAVHLFWNVLCHSYRPSPHFISMHVPQSFQEIPINITYVCEYNERTLCP